MKRKRLLSILLALCLTFSLTACGFSRSAPDIAGQNKANPSAILMAFAMMLNDLGMADKAARLNGAILELLTEGKTLTADVGGTATTTEFTAALADKLR